MTGRGAVMRRRRGDVVGPGSRPDPFLDALLSLPVTAYVNPRAVLAVDDRRRYDPAGPLRPAYSFGRDARRIIAKSSPVGSPRNDTNISARVGFAVPKRVAVCVRRQQRKEVLHAFKRAGGGVSRKRRRNEWSNVDC